MILIGEVFPFSRFKVIMTFSEGDICLTDLVTFDALPHHTADLPCCPALTVLTRALVIPLLTLLVVYSQCVCYWFLLSVS